jgi:hypothetical protein
MDQRIAELDRLAKEARERSDCGPSGEDRKLDLLRSRLNELRNKKSVLDDASHWAKPQDAGRSVYGARSYATPTITR